MEEDDQAPNWRSWVPSNGAGHSAVAQRALAGQGAARRSGEPRKRSRPRRFEELTVLTRPCSNLRFGGHVAHEPCMHAPDGLWNECPDRLTTLGPRSFLCCNVQERQQQAPRADHRSTASEADKLVQAHVEHLVAEMVVALDRSTSLTPSRSASVLRRRACRRSRTGG